MKRLIPLLFIFCAVIFIPPQQARAAEDGNPPSNVTITVVMPDAAPEQGQEREPSNFPSLPSIPAPGQTPEQTAPAIPRLYPTGVHEVLENGVRWIIKVYELGAGESPADIPCGGFDRNGWNYAITDITKKETAAADVREHTEIATLNTDTKEMEAILRQIPPTMEYASEEGYAGVLALDVSSIAVETAGTKTSSYTASATREYPHLSSNDTSLLPKTITDGGRTLTLASVDWKTNHTATVDYEQVPASYTAVATYTANASRTVVTGYVTTAEYTGSVSRLNQGVTIYTAYFMGTEIKPERIPLEIIEPAPDAAPEPAPDAAAEQETATEPEADPEPEPTAGTDAGEVQAMYNGAASSLYRVIIPAVLFALMLGAGVGYYVPRIKKTKTKKGESST
jgi:hypothetical protein